MNPIFQYARARYVDIKVGEGRADRVVVTVANSDTVIREAEKQRRDLDSPPVKIDPLGPKDVRKDSK